MGRRRSLAPTVVLAIAVGFMGTSVWYRASAAREPTLVVPDSKIVDSSVPESKLLQSVLYVDEWWEFGNPVGFTYLPKFRPPGLVSVAPGNPPNLSGGSHRGTGNGALIDSYHFKVGGSRLQGVVEFSARPTSTCGAMKGVTHAVCVRNKALSNPSPTDPDIKYMTVYFTGYSDAALMSADAAKAKRFWANVDMVPIKEAAWFTDLVSRARAAVLE